jgi:hypothetical protein
MRSRGHPASFVTQATRHPALIPPPVEQAADGLFVDVLTAECVGLVELDGSVQFEDRPAAGAVGKEVDADEVRLERVRGLERE